MPGKRKKRSFWKKLRIQYKLSFFNENTLEEVWHIRLSRLTGFFVFLVLVAVLFAAAAFFIVFTPVKTLLPGYLKQETRAQLVDDALQLDSMQQVTAQRDRYIVNLRAILSGDIPIDSVVVTDSALIFPADSLFSPSKATTHFMQRYEEEEKYTLSLFSNTVPTDGLLFSVPARGAVSRPYDPASRFYGVELLSPVQSDVAAVLDGTVISAERTDDAGYVITLQHNGGFLSVYRYNSALLKSVGDAVVAGEAIALTGKGKDEGMPLFEFQLWSKGVPLNPQDYIAF